MKLMMSNYEVETEDDSISSFTVNLVGPKDSPYEGGVWKVRVELPMDYPYKSPSIGFVNRMFHPNVDELSGSVCLDVINQTWTPMYDLINVFQVFLPQLLLYPNPSDPLNGEAAALMMRDPDKYKQRIKATIASNAVAQPTAEVNESMADEAGDDSELSELSAMSEDDGDDQFELEQ